MKEVGASHKTTQEESSRQWEEHYKGLKPDRVPPECWRLVWQE